MPESRKAESRVSRPMTSSAPKTSSKSPPAPLMVMGEALFIGPTGKFKYLVVPCCRISNPDMMRSTLSSCAVKGLRKSIANPHAASSIRQAGRLAAQRSGGRATIGLGPIDIQDSHRESVLIHCASDQLIRSAAHGEAIRAQ